MIIYIIYLNANGVKTGVLRSPPPSTTLSSVLYNNEQKCLLVLPSTIRRFQQKWMCQSHGIFQLPSSLIRTVVLPLHLYLSNGSILEHGDFSIEDAQWFCLELSLGFHLDHIPIYHMVRIMYIFLKQRNMKNIWSLVLSGNASLYATGPILSSTSNGPQYLGDSLAQIPSFKELFLRLTVRKTWSSTLNSLCTLCLSA